MPPRDLSRRAADATELMDDPQADPQALARTYRRFGLVNRVLSGWHGLYRQHIRPRIRGGDVRILDIGSGGGDIARALAVWAGRDASRLHVTALDADPRATAWARVQDGPATVSYVTATARDLVAAGDRFDVVVSNHLLHHLADAELADLLRDSGELLVTDGLAVHSDIARSPAAHRLFAALTLPFQPTLLAGSFIRADGLTSIRRSFTPAELRAIAPPEWTVSTAAPCRVLLMRDGGDV